MSSDLSSRFDMPSLDKDEEDEDSDEASLCEIELNDFLQPEKIRIKGVTLQRKNNDSD